MKSFLDCLTEATSLVTAEVTFAGDEKAFSREATKYKISVKYGKNRYADIAILSGEKSKIDKFLKEQGYFSNEISYY